jgi:hypothetical protein
MRNIEVGTHVHKIACPLLARCRKNDKMAQALRESSPEVGSSRNRSNFGCIKLISRMLYCVTKQECLRC